MEAQDSSRTYLAHHELETIIIIGLIVVMIFVFCIIIHYHQLSSCLQAYSRHSLSRAALVTAGAPIFLLDTFSQLVLYYVEGYPASIPFPPPQSSLLRKTIQALKQHRQVTPQLKMLRGKVTCKAWERNVIGLLVDVALNAISALVTPAIASRSVLIAASWLRTKNCMQQNTHVVLS